MSGRCSCASKKHGFASRWILVCAEIGRIRCGSVKRPVNHEPRNACVVARRLAVCFRKGYVVRRTFCAWNDEERCQKESSR